MDTQKIAESLFKHYPSVNEFYITEDGQAFELKNNAAAHAASLNAKEPKVETITRGEKKAAKTQPVIPEEPVKPVEQGKHVEPVEPVEPVKPQAPKKPVSKAAKTKA